MLGSGQLSDLSDSRRASHVSELSTRKSVKTAADSMGLGRTISKKSLDVAIRHMVSIALSTFFFYTELIQLASGLLMVVDEVISNIKYLLLFSF